MMGKKKFFLFIFLLPCFAGFSFSQDKSPGPLVPGKSNFNIPECSGCGVAQLKFYFLPNSLKVNSGVLKKEGLDFPSKKEYWVNNVLLLFSKNLSEEQKTLLKDKLMNENLDDLANGKILF